MTDSIPVFVADLWRRSNEVREEQEQVVDPAELASLANALSDAHAIQYGIVAAFVICIYDYMLTVGDEVRLFWPKTDTKLTTTLYFLSRYLPLFVLFVAICRQLACFIYSSVLSLISLLENNPLPHIVFSDPVGVFGLRIYTLYYHSKLVQRGMVIIFVLGTIVITILTGFISRTMIEGAKWFTVIEACIPPPSNAIPGVLVTSVIMETGVAAATVWHAITSSDFRKDLPQSAVINILNGIYVQGGLYFLVIVACRITNMFLCWFASGSLFLVDVYIEFALASVITTRWSIIMRDTIHQSGVNNTGVIGPSGYSHSTRPKDGGTSHHGSYPLDRLDARIRKNRNSQIVSANIHFVKGSGSEGNTDSTPYSFIETEPHVGTNPHDARSIQEVELGATDLNAHLENHLAEGMTMAGIKEVNNVPRAPSIGSSPADLNNQGTDDAGAPVYKSKSLSASAAASTVSVGIRARLSADTVGRGSTGAHSMKDLELA